MKNILISIKPEWVEKILNGEKTIEIRKTIPKCVLPCKVYIYCTKSQKKLLTIFRKGDLIWSDDKDEQRFDKTIFVKDDYFSIADERHRWLGKVVAEFTLNKVEEIMYLTDRESVKKHGCWECKLEDKWKIENGFNKSQFNPEDYSNYYTEGSDDNYLIFYSKVTGTELHNYLKGQTGYAWHIDDLIIYDKPKELSDFEKFGSYKNIKNCPKKLNGYCNKGYGMKGTYVGCEKARLKRPPQSYMFVEEIGRQYV